MKNNTPFIQQFSIRVLLILFWLFIFIGFLYLPALLKFFKAPKEINIISYTDLIDPNHVRAFEKEYEVSVNFSYFENNEELLLKMQATQGEGYDLILPSDYIVKELINSNLLQPIKKEKLTFWHRLEPRLLNLYFDSKNRFTIPYNWSIYGLGVDTIFFNALLQASWDLIFKPKEDYKITILDNPREIIILAAYYLFGRADHLNDEQFRQIKELLIKQKKWIEAYNEFRADYFLFSGTVPIVIIAAPYLHRLKKNNPQVEFIVPKEGTFSIVDSFVITKSSKQEELVYAFLNYVYKKETLEHNFKMQILFPATIELQDLFKNNSVPLSIYTAYFGKDIHLNFFKNTIPKDILNKIWIELKAS